MFKKQNKETINKELELYRSEKILEINSEIVEIMNTKRKEVQDLALQCANQKGEYEHEFHSEREKLGVELAKLDSEVEMKKQIQEKESACLNKEVANLREMIDDKNETITELLKKLPEVNVKEINCNCNK